MGIVFQIGVPEGQWARFVYARIISACAARDCPAVAAGCCIHLETEKALLGWRVIT